MLSHRALVLSVRRFVVSAQAAVNRLLRPADLLVVKRSGMGTSADDNVRRLIGEPRTIFDVGAHVGQTYARYRRRFPRAVIHCFEPAPRTLPALRARTQGDPLAEVHDFALSDRRGDLELNVFPESTANSLLAPVVGDASPEWLRRQTSVRVRVETLDDFCAERRIDGIDLLKIDAQGADLLVMRGGARTFAAGKVRAAYFEVTFDRNYHGQATFHECFDFLAAFGFEFVDFYEKVRTARSSMAYCNALFVAPVTPPRP
jgi:FkbM family methyltransferase